MHAVSDFLYVLLCNKNGFTNISLYQISSQYTIFVSSVFVFQRIQTQFSQDSNTKMQFTLH